MRKIVFIIVFIMASVLYSEYSSQEEKWSVIEKVDPFTDEREISIFMKKQEENSLNFNTLSIKITKNNININLYTPSLLFKERFNDEDKIDLIYRLDKNETRTMQLNKYGESELYSLTNSQNASGNSIVFLKELLSSDTLAIRGVEFIESAKHTYTYVYDLKPLRELLLGISFDNTILKNYESEITSIILQKQEKDKNENAESNEGSENKDSENMYKVDDIDYTEEQPII